MTEYVVNYENGYKIQKVFANKNEDGNYGDIYDFESDVKNEHPNDEVLIGYVVISELSGLIPNGCRDWNNTINEAMDDYEQNITP